MAIRNLLEGKTNKEQATIKGQEIAKIGSVARTNVKFSDADYDIEIVSMNPIDGGVEVLVRAWDSNGQVGFGKDGSVDIERFRIFNPPILIDDPNGDIIQDNGKFGIRKLREDTQKAILQSLVHTISVKKQKFGADKIIFGKVGNTTTTVYSTAGGDGKVLKDSTTWAGARDVATGDAANKTNAVENFAISYHDDVPTYEIVRGFFPFGVSGVTNGDTVNSAVLSLFGLSKTDQDNDGNDYISITESRQASATDLTTADFDAYQTTLFAANLDIGDASIIAYNDFTLNASGITYLQSAIDGTSFIADQAMFTTREGHDVANDPITDIGADTTNTLVGYMADQAGTTNDPKLVIEHAAVGGGGVFRRRMLTGIGA